MFWYSFASKLNINKCEADIQMIDKIEGLRGLIGVESTEDERGRTG